MIPLPRSLRLAALLLLPALPAFAAEPPPPIPTAAPASEAGVLLSVVPDHANGLYALGEKVTWTVDVKSGSRATLTALPYVIRQNGQPEVGHGTLDLSAGPATMTGTLAEPGALLAVISSADAAVKKPLGLGGAVIAADQIGPVLPAPDDFDAFWDGKLKEIAAIPANPVLEKVEGLPNADGVDYYKVTLDNINGTHVRGQLARPTTGEKFPAMLVVQWAGVYPLDKNWVLAPAREGYLVLNIEAHDIPIDEPAAFYADLGKGALNGYTAIGEEDRETSYFLRMFLGDVQAVQYLASRPDWDGRVLIVTGGSQGGLQSFATAALCPKVTHMMTWVTAGCDVYAPLATPPRAASWPSWLSIWGGPAARGHDVEKVKKTAGYFDPIYFAHRITCPALVAPGLIDETARPTGIFAAFNALASPVKELVPLPLTGHNSGSQQAYHSRAAVWRTALKKNEPIPPAAP
ncbi:Cephalosporin-C deacetylase [Verrucomicrobium sp. GAS474]|uniref:acetylxylan esterase n=1 Tax=Verrucomicrobium sp. GAS474 TaxID=1882831 RepID=UPI00087C85A6|nr:acetylxylan esterase [Verrucomicrobium sp. GAS474]SDT92725.1 Cephalosporin-C deacetylase [Verrucomicrobium sp. GAS474]